MRRLALWVGSAVLLAAPAFGAEGGERPLFNGKNFDGWHFHIRHADKSDPTADPKGVFQVEDGVIHVSGEEFGCLTTDEEFSDYRLSLEFKWGEKRYPPRENAKRDAGVLMHCVGPEKVWPKSIECQIQEGDCGDFYMVGGAELTIDGKRFDRGRGVKTKDAEKPRGQWNTVEVICQGGKITNKINGEVVNEGTDSSVTKGKIVLQSEGAELFYRNVKIEPLGSSAE
jgi:hypothetical protein